ncbi:MAG: hypothetical protein AAGE94_10105 [Acidobacteriota bacterium]
MASLRRRPLLLIGGALVVSAGAWVAGTWFTASIEARRQAEQIDAFARQATAQAAALRAITTQPLHDLRATRDEVRRQLEVIADELGVGTPRPLDGASPTASYRIGQLTLALGDAESACRHLDHAWALGARETGLAVERARAHDLATRDRLRLDLDLDHDGGGSTVVIDSLEAIPADADLDDTDRAWIAVLRGFHGTPRRSVDASLDAIGAEGALLRADAALVAARGATNALEALDEAGALYRRAIEATPSEPRGYAGLCSTWTEVLAHELDATAGRSDAMVPASYGDRAETACADGLVADPDDPTLLVAMARLQRLVAEADRRRGDDPSPSAATTEEAVRRLIAGRQPEPAWVVAGLRWLGEARLVRARWLEERGEDPSADLDAAETALAEARRLQQR